MTPEEYEKDQKEKMDNFKIGNQDSSGNTIKKVFVKSDDYVIYEIDTPILSESFRVYIHSKKQNDPDGLEKNFEDIKQNLNEVKAVLYKAKRENSYKQIMASAVAHGISGEIDKSKESLDNIQTRINNEYKEEFESKIIYFSISLFSTIILIILSILNYTNVLFDKSSFPILNELIYIITFGSLGGIVSISIKLKDIEMEKDISKWYFAFYGIERIFIAMVGSIFIYFAIKSNLLFGVLNTVDNPIYSYITIAILAGFSETLVPDMLKRIETNLSQNDS